MSAFKIKDSYHFVLYFFNGFNNIIFILSPDLTSVPEMQIKDKKVYCSKKCCCNIISNFR